ncbi:hypothetical protein K493DRAFT_238760 [Basidiobolus meristosporus CBS 931.73]|uniref:DUF803-domain-containing protein n=1 Tax=Basidiobolus meristosporus CBS 931.73 TaxID=1314790 RepID=A0A1Y1XHQ9_9FUNG|nr:hypothetical protein K493DRAFT_238760 [Basidiobolus meristosporus CBS 931.73]|eukprot:ORX85280.1 hypothetical protein K493DRAFT_238760 [Basidiobolus meristosporus CBS 931.73]
MAPIVPAFTDYLIGFIVSLAASFLNALGLNIMKRDHSRNEALSTELQKHEFLRVNWHIGLYLYAGSQMFGNTIALNYLKTQWVAPLGAVSLIFNFLFAKMLVGTPITRKDIYGTAVVILCVVWIVVWGGRGTGEDGRWEEPVIAADRHVTLLGYVVSRRRLEKTLGMCMAGIGGLVASQTLLLAKSGVKLFTITMTQTNQFTDSLSFLILVGLVITSVMQIYCLNAGLKLADSVLIVPIFFGFYTSTGLINTIIYLNQLANYEVWVLSLILVGIFALIYGVRLLSQAKPDPGASVERLEFGKEKQLRVSYRKPDDPIRYSKKSHLWTNDDDGFENIKL